MEYDIYHDESQEAGYWHGILLVPIMNRSVLLDVLKEIRANTNYFDPVAMKGINKPSGKPFQTTRSFASFSTCALTQRLKRESCGYITGKIIQNDTGKREFEYKNIKNPICAKFIVSRIVDHLKSLNNHYYRDHCEKMEVTFCHALKGGIHFLGEQENPISIRSIHFDGYKQYGRHVSLDKILSGMNNLRPYCSMSSKISIDDRSSDHREQDSQFYDGCQLLQLTDVLIGAFRTILGDCKNSIQEKISVPIRQLVDRWNQGYARMKNSRWYKGFCISECIHENGLWQFRQINKEEQDPSQISLLTL